MVRIQWKYSVVFVLVVLLQVLIFNNIRLGGYLNPQVYVFFILILPQDVRKWVLLTSAFFLGLAVDLFSDSLAIHTASAVLMAYLRPSVMQAVSGKTIADEQLTPSFSAFGVFSLFAYCLILIFIHHFALFFLEVFRFSGFVQTFGRVLLSSGLSLLFVMMGFALSEPSSGRTRG